MVAAAALNVIVGYGDANRRKDKALRRRAHERWKRKLINGQDRHGAVSIDEYALYRGVGLPAANAPRYVARVSN